MGTASVNLGLSELTQVGSQISTIASTLEKAIPSSSYQTDLWPIKNLGLPQRPLSMGIPTMETYFHKSLEQGRFNEHSIGDALAWVRKEQYELNQKIAHYLDLNRVSTGSQLKWAPRTVKLVADCVRFMKQVQAYVQQIEGCVVALETNIQMLNAMEAQMANIIQKNLTDLANLMNAICNWRLPTIPSLAALIGYLSHWNGFNLNKFAGFSFNPNMNFTFNFTFNQCALQTGDYSQLFTNPSSSLPADPIVFSYAQPSIPGAATADPSLYGDTAYIASMQAETALVLDPATSPVLGSLPNPAAIVSNYSLTPADYYSNVISTVSALEAAVVTSSEGLQPLLAQYVTLAQVVSSKYDPNLMAAWLFYLNLNLAGRSGKWLPGFAAVYAELIQPSLTYLATADVPWNTVLGGTGTSAAPAAIPLISTLKNDSSGHYLWQLSFIEASLLGYSRTTLWDAGADAAFLSSFTGSDLDYAFTEIGLLADSTVILGADTAEYPVTCSYPTAIATNLLAVIAQAAIDIRNTPTYRADRPQFMYTYDQFAQATMVDRFTQFWRVFNANLVALLAQDPYFAGFVTSYVATLNGALNPLADQTAYAALELDASLRSRIWTPGSSLLNVPTALTTQVNNTVPEDTGWANGVLTASTFLARPDIQALPIPTQMAMLRLNQSYASLLTVQSNFSSAIADAVTLAQASIQTATQPGWQIETTTTLTVPAGSGVVVAFPQVDFAQQGYVENAQTVVIQKTGSYAMIGDFQWDPAGAAGTRTVDVLVNGDSILTASVESNSAEPFALQFSTSVQLNQGDSIQIQLTHNLGTKQSLLSGSSFMGLADTNAAPQDTLPVSTSGATKTFIADTTLAALTAVSVQSDGGVTVVNPTYSSPTPVPFVDGITVAAAASGKAIALATNYGTIYQVPGASFTVGGLLYVGTAGVLTQDYSSVSGSGFWTICVGKATAVDSFLYEPQIPQHS